MKKKFLSAVLTTTMIMSSIVPVTADTQSSRSSVDLEDGLIGEYLFDGDWKDTINPSISATVYSEYGTSTESVIVESDERGSVAEMKGEWQNTGYLVLDQSYLSKIQDGFTVSMWAKANNSKENTVDEDGNVTLDISNCGSSTALFNFKTHDDEAGFIALDVSLDVWINAFDGTGDSNPWIDRMEVDGAMNLSTESWQNVVMAIDPEANNISIYVDGQLKRSASLGGGTMAQLMTDIQNASAIQIGTMKPWWDTWDFRGYVDDVRMYNRALSADEVVALKNIAPDTSVVDTKNIQTSAPKTYAQYKQEDDGEYTVRFITEVSVDTLEDYAAVGFTCTKDDKTATGTDSNVYKTIVANGKTVTAGDNTYYAIVEVQNVPKDAQFTIQAVGQETADGEVTALPNTSSISVNMSNIVK